MIIAPFALATAALSFAVSDLFSRQKRKSENSAASRQGASVVIPNWNGRDLLEKYLPSVIAALSGNTSNEIIVVDNASSDGSAAFVREHFPAVRVLELERNRGFGGGSNAGFEVAQNDIVVLLNSDMRVEADFLAPLLEPFADAQVFSVACQIFFTDAARLREETGLTQAWWENGGLRVRHRRDDAIIEAYPCFYGGGGSCAYDRRKFLELRGFDELLAPFYLEDTDLGYMAWKRGWKVLYEPRSVVFHEHRGTIGKHFRREQIEAVLKKNFVLFCWKNIHSWRMLASHFFFSYMHAILTVLLGPASQRTNFAGLFRALEQLPGAMRSRRSARELAEITDEEAFRRPLGGYYRDRFTRLEPVERPAVLFVSPYPIMPPIHGGGVFMYQTSKRLAELCPLHLIVLLEHPWEREEHAELERACASVEYLERLDGQKKQFGSPVPHAVSEYASGDLEWLIHRVMYTQRIDVVQLEYTAMAQYGMGLRQIPCILFEHDVYFQSIGRALDGMPASASKVKATFEYLRALRYELTTLPRFDRIQVCSADNRDFLVSFAPELRDRIDDELRAGIDTSRYRFHADAREPRTMLFLGNFRHIPNQIALAWFTREVLPRILAVHADARLVVVGAEAPARHSLGGPESAIELRGFVKDVREPLSEYSVFLCPILSGSGMRVKLLEAFAAGIPVVSTRLGAEGLVNESDGVCALADSAEEFAQAVLRLFDEPDEATGMARRARTLVEEKRDMGAMTRRLVGSYVQAIQRKREAAHPPVGDREQAARLRELTPS